MADVLVVLPWESLVTVNRKVRTREASTQQYKQALEAMHLHALDQVRGERPRFSEQAVMVTLDFYPPDFRRRDIANYTKALFDALKGVVYADDYQIRDYSARRHNPDKGGAARVEITVRAA